MNRSEQRVYCWIRQQRYLIAVYKYIYYMMDEQILDDLQYDYLKKRLEAVEKRWVDVSHAVTDEGYLPPKYYADVIIHPSVQKRALQMVRRWIRGGRKRIYSIPYLNNNGEYNDIVVYRDALRSIVKYPIDHI